jgi:phosphate transport system protein
MAKKTKLTEEQELTTAQLVEMAGMAQAAILDSVASVKTMDTDLAQRVIDTDDEIDEKELLINDMCLKILATQSPLAGDLRYTISLMHVARDLERIGDHCENIAEYALHFDKAIKIKELIDIPRMAVLASDMVKNAIDSFVHRDVRLARKVYRGDSDVDSLYHTIYEELITMAEKEQDRERVRQMLGLIYIARYLERVADYATNICEETMFVLEGSYEME